ncbi:MAG TPA: hypothetical protein VE422_34940 [Terriglobia bacterium]|nr:hypothetical protein [Terriglobia bacterium]
MARIKAHQSCALQSCFPWVRSSLEISQPEKGGHQAQAVSSRDQSFRETKMNDARGAWEGLHPAWLAGFVDGEGCITYCNPTCPTIQITLANTSESTMRFICAATSCGAVYPMADKKGRCKPAWHWKVSAAAQVREILKAIAPYVLTKKRQVDIALLMVDAILAGDKYHKTHADREYRVELMRQLRVLNRKGIMHETDSG